MSKHINFTTPSFSLRQRIRMLLCRHRFSSWGVNLVPDNKHSEMRIRCCQKCLATQVGCHISDDLAQYVVAHADDLLEGIYPGIDYRSDNA